QGEHRVRGSESNSQDDAQPCRPARCQHHQGAGPGQENRQGKQPRVFHPYLLNVEMTRVSSVPHQRRTWIARASATIVIAVSATRTVMARLWPMAGFPAMPPATTMIRMVPLAKTCSATTILMRLRSIRRP